MTGTLTGVSHHTIENILHQIQTNNVSVSVLVLFAVDHFNDFRPIG